MFPDYQVLDGPRNPDGPLRNRPTLPRIQDYGLLGLVRPDSSVLDIGCNAGLFGYCLSPSIGRYLGIDHAAESIRLARAQAPPNCTFVCQSFRDFSVTERFDLVLCLAVHAYFAVPMEDAASKLAALLAPNGSLILEGHPAGCANEPGQFFEPLHRSLTRRLFVRARFTVEDRAMKREVLRYAYEAPGSISTASRLPDGTVKKTHQQLAHWRRERNAYAKLKAAGITRSPQVLAENEQELSLTMTYAGEPLCPANLPPDWLEQLSAIEAELKQARIGQNDLFIKNLAVLDGALYLFDYDLAYTPARQDEPTDRNSFDRLKHDISVSASR